MRRLKCLLSVLILSSLLSCENQGTGSFFEDPPDCFYDSLFGCGTFDIPSNSSYYGYRQRSLKSSSDFSATLKSSVNRQSSTCTFQTPKKLAGNISLKKLNDRVSLKIPISSKRSISLRGKARKNGFSATSTGLISICRYSASGDLSAKDSKQYSVDIKLKLNCLFQEPCAVDYRGKATI